MSDCKCIYRGEGEYSTCTLCGLKSQLEHERREKAKLCEENEQLRAQVLRLQIALEREQVGARGVLG